MNVLFTKALAFAAALALIGCSRTDLTQPTVNKVVLVDLSPSMTGSRTQQTQIVKEIVEQWQPYETVEFIVVDGNPLGRAPLARMTAFFYDKNTSNPTRYRLETAELRKKYLSTIPQLIADAIRAEDDRNKKRGNVSETCLVDGFETAARLFRRTPAQSREILVLSDGYEDCGGSLHLPHEPLSAGRIQQVIGDLEKRNRLPRFMAPTTARFIGTRLNSQSSRGYEDEVEDFWINLLTRSGIEIRSENFTPTLEGEN